MKPGSEGRAKAEKFFDDNYQDYVEIHGHHFTDELAEYASRQMHNANGDSHTWTCREVEDTMKSLDIPKPKGSTIGDLTYSANMAYADFYPLVLTDAASCVLYARAVAMDKDGYEGIQFYRWLADLMANDIQIDWKDFV